MYMYYNMFKYTSTTIFSSTKVQQYLRVCTTICLNMYVQHNEYINTDMSRMPKCICKRVLQYNEL